MGWFACEVAVFVVALLKLSDEGDLIIGIVGLQLIGDVALFACGGESVAVLPASSLKLRDGGYHVMRLCSCTVSKSGSQRETN